MELGAAPASRPGLLPPLGQEGAQGLPAAPGDGGAEAAKSGKKKKAKKKLGNKRRWPTMCSFSAPKAKEDDDTSGDDPFIRGAQGRPQKKAENEAKHRSSRESITSSEDMRRELF